MMENLKGKSQGININLVNVMDNLLFAYMNEPAL